MKTDLEVLFRAIDQLNEDEEFSNRMALSGGDPHIVVRYLIDRGVDDVDAKLLGLVYCAGAHHANVRFSNELKRISSGSKS